MCAWFWSNRSKSCNTRVETWRRGKYFLKIHLIFTWRRGRKVSNVTRASEPPLLFVDCTWEWKFKKKKKKKIIRIDFTSFFTSPSVGFWPNARSTSPTWVTWNTKQEVKKMQFLTLGSSSLFQRERIRVGFYLTGFVLAERPLPVKTKAMGGRRADLHKAFLHR